MRKRLRRHRNVTPADDRPAKAASTVTIEQSHARRIRELPTEQFATVVEAIREGAKSGDIARYFAEEGWLTVKEATFVQYLTAFKRIYPELIVGGGGNSINSLVSPRQPSLDEEAQLEQLIRVQKSRLKIGMDFETNTGILNQHLHKDINATVNMVEQLAKMRGKLSGAGRPAEGSNVQMPAEAQEQLRKSASSEHSQDRMASLIGKLGSLIQQRASSE